MSCPATFSFTMMETRLHGRSGEAVIRYFFIMGSIDDDDNYYLDNASDQIGAQMNRLSSIEFLRSIVSGTS